MKVFLTGATGFVGSHILDVLRERRIPTAVLLRERSDTQFIAPHLSELTVHRGALDAPAALGEALESATHVIHCAGCTKAVDPAQFFRVNQAGTRHLVEAINSRANTIRRLVHISSLAASHPAGPERPAREDDPPQPVSAYGQSKLGAEREVREGCQVPFVILRPPAVYGPRDHEFLALFKMIRARLAIQFGGGRMPLSLVYVRDLAVTAVEALTHPQAAGRTYNVASPEVVTTAQLADEIAVQMQVRPLRVPLPTALLWPVCVGLEAVSKITGQATVLTRQKHPELRAPGWVCDPARLRDEMRVTCPTSCRSGVGETLSWYRQAGWL